MSLLLKKKCCCVAGTIAEGCCKFGGLCLPVQLLTGDEVIGGSVNTDWSSIGGSSTRPVAMASGSSYFYQSTECGKWRWDEVYEPLDGGTTVYIRRVIQITDVSVYPWVATTAIICSVNADFSSPFVNITGTGARVYGSSAVNHTVAWSNGENVALRVRASECCNDSGDCGEGTKLVDAAGKTCCTFRYGRVQAFCGPQTIDAAYTSSTLWLDTIDPPAPNVFYNESETKDALVVQIDGKAHLVTAEATHCQVPAGGSLATPDATFNDRHVRCIGFNRCTGVDEDVAEARSLVAPANIKIDQWGSIFSGIATITCTNGPDVTVPDTTTWPFAPTILAEYARNNEYTGGFSACSSSAVCRVTADAIGYGNIGYWLRLIAQCAYLEFVESVWNEEIEDWEDVYALVPAEHYWELIISIGCGPYARAVYRAPFDPADPTTPGESGNFSLTTTALTVMPSGVSAISTVTITDIWDLGTL